VMADLRQLGVAGPDRWRHIRLDDAKANLAPLAAARWFRMVTVALGNATAEYPHGDQVAAIEPWRPSSPWAAHTPAELNRVLDLLAAGPGLGFLYAPNRRGRVQSRWAGDVLMQRLGVNEAQAALMVETWLKTGLLVLKDYRDNDQRRWRTGVAVNDSRRPAAAEPDQETAR